MFAHTADVYAPDDASYDSFDGMQRTTTDIQRLAPGSNVPGLAGPPIALVAVAALVVIIGLIHHFGGKR